MYASRSQHVGRPSIIDSFCAFYRCAARPRDTFILSAVYELSFVKDVSRYTVTRKFADKSIKILNGADKKGKNGASFMAGASLLSSLRKRVPSEN